MEIIWTEARGATCHSYSGGLPDGLAAVGEPQRTIWTSEERPGVMVFVYGGDVTEVGYDYFDCMQDADDPNLAMRTTLPSIDIEVLV
jgi:hypothetical protein